MSLLRPPPGCLALRTGRRAFSSSPAAPVSLQIDRVHPDAVADTVPEYPHGPARWYKQSNKGLYGGQRIQFGNNVSGRFETKTRRTFQVNVVTKRLWSHALDRFVQVRITARTLRTIDRVGGLDEYLLGNGAARIKQLGVSGWWLRWAIMQQPSVKERFRKERKALGLGSREGYGERLKALETVTEDADLEEAYSALPEAVDAEPAVGEQLDQDVLEAAAAEAQARDALEVSTDKPVDEAALETGAEEPPDEQAIEATEDDAATEMEADRDSSDTLSVTNPPDLPPIKFRVDRRTHIKLGPNGWVRCRPDTTKFGRQWIANNVYRTYVEDKMGAFEVNLIEAKRRDPNMRDMSLLEEREVRNAARRQFQREMEKMVEVRYAALGGLLARERHVGKMLTVRRELTALKSAKEGRIGKERVQMEFVDASKGASKDANGNAHEDAIGDASRDANGNAHEDAIGDASRDANDAAAGGESRDRGRGRGRGRANGSGGSGSGSGSGAGGSGRPATLKADGTPFSRADLPAKYQNLKPLKHDEYA